MTPALLEELAEGGRVEEAFLPVGDLLPLPRVVLTDDDGHRFRHGSTLTVPQEPSGRVAVFAGSTLLGVGVVAAALLQPDKVLPSEMEP